VFCKKHRIGVVRPAGTGASNIVRTERLLKPSDSDCCVNLSGEVFHAEVRPNSGLRPIPKKVHFDGAKDEEAEVLIVGEGAATSTPAEEK
jgi:hypothetical protein